MTFTGRHLSVLRGLTIVLTTLYKNHITKEVLVILYLIEFCHHFRGPLTDELYCNIARAT